MVLVGFKQMQGYVELRHMDLDDYLDGGVSMGTVYFKQMLVDVLEFHVWWMWMTLVSCYVLWI